MKIRSRTGTTKIEQQMAPMIDVVFQLLIFFMLTLKIVEPEGDFDINMPLGAPAQAAVTDADLPALRVRMVADEDGQLKELLFNNQPLVQRVPRGNSEEVFRLLNEEIARSVTALKTNGGDQSVEKQEVEIDPDYELRYTNIISAISACSGKMENGRMIRYFSRIKFSSPRKGSTPE